MKNISKFRIIIQLLFVLLTVIGILNHLAFIKITVMIMTLLAGAFYCGWICPFGTLQDLMSKLGRLLKIRKIKMPSFIQKYLKYSRYLLLALIMFTGFDLLFSLISYDARTNFNSLLVGKITSVGTVLVLISFVMISLFFERPFCNYFCIEGAKNGLMSLFRVFTIKRDTTKCVNCKKCDQACPMHIEVSKHTNLRSLNCINCFSCISGCPVENTLKYGKVNLKGKQKKYSTLVLIFVTILISFGIIYSVTLDSTPNKTLENQLNSDSTYEQSIQASPILSEESHNTHTEESLTESVIDSNPVSEQTLTESSASHLYNDGVYTGTGEGFKGTMEVSVTIENDQITDVTVLSNRDDRKWFNRANNVIPQSIINAQSTDVDTVTGATFSSLGIIEGAKNAIENAK